MSFLSDIRYKKLSHTVTIDDFIKEIFRKSIHVCSAAVPFFSFHYLSETIVVLSFLLCIYLLSERLRLSGKSIIFVSKITAFASRRDDEGKFVLGPVTLVLGIIISLVVFPNHIARVGIFALAFGDGIASVAGKLFGKKKFLYSKYKTVAGSLSCFVAVFLSSLISTERFFLSLEIAVLAMVIETLPLKDYDNLLIPILISCYAFIRS